jgi:hypothetical protein
LRRLQIADDHQVRRGFHRGGSGGQHARPSVRAISLLDANCSAAWKSQFDRPALPHPLRHDEKLRESLRSRPHGLQPIATRRREVGQEGAGSRAGIKRALVSTTAAHPRAGGDLEVFDVSVPHNVKVREWQRRSWTRGRQRLYARKYTQGPIEKRCPALLVLGRAQVRGHEKASVVSVLGCVVAIRSKLVQPHLARSALALKARARKALQSDAVRMAGRHGASHGREDIPRAICFAVPMFNCFARRPQVLFGCGLAGGRRNHDSASSMNIC